MKLHLEDDDADGDDEVSTSHQCVDCQTWSPKTSSGHTLISAQYGWRLLRLMRDGDMVLEWRCAGCWQRYKLAKGPGTETPTSNRRVPPPAASRPAESSSTGRQLDVPPSSRTGDAPPESTARPLPAAARPPLSEVIRSVFSRKS